MRLTVTKVTHAARFALVLAAMCPLLARSLGSSQDPGLFATAWPPRFILAVSMAALAFASAPRWRRSDIIRLVGAYAVCLLLADRWLQGNWQFGSLAAYASGGCAVFVCSCLETLRRLARLTPEANISEVYPLRRRSHQRMHARAAAV